MRRVLAGLLLIVLSAAGAWADTWTIEPGVGIGPMKLGSSWATEQKRFGKPDSTEHRDQNTDYYEYEKHGVVYGVEGGHVVRISVKTPADGAVKFATKQGVGVGTSRAEAIKQLGNPQDSMGTAIYSWPGIRVLILDNGSIGAITVQKK